MPLTASPTSWRRWQGLYVALSEVPQGVEATVVHDDQGVGAFMEEGRWQR